MARIATHGSVRGAPLVTAGSIKNNHATPYVIAVCYTGTLATGHAVDDPAAQLIARISSEIWAQRHELGIDSEQ